MKRHGKYRDWWSAVIRSALKRYPNELKIENSRQAKILLDAIGKAMAEASQSEDETEKEAAELVTLFYIRKSNTFQGACDKVGVSVPTGKRRVAKMVKKIGNYAGYT